MQRTAGNQLFYVIVEDDKVASRCIEALNKGKLGRLTFLPLNSLDPRVVTAKDNALYPMLSALRIDERFQKAAQSVWGRTYIAKSGDVGAQAARQHDIECCTMDGDKVRSFAACRMCRAMRALAHTHARGHCDAHPSSEQHEQGRSHQGQAEQRLLSCTHSTLASLSLTD